MFGIINSTAQNVLVQGILQQNLEKAARRYMTGRLVDIGCGDKPYKDLVSPYVSSHIGVDHIDTFHDKSEIDIFGSAYKVPEPDASFDSAMCTAVLEHLEEPEAALRECYRILKPGAYAVYSVPFIWHLHEEPRDFFRFSKYGLEYLFTKVGFELVELNALSGFWVTFGQLLVYNIHRFNRGPLRWLGLINIVGLIIQFISYALDKIDKSEKWTWMYMVVARKP